jgi:hypothetical protein
MFILCCTVLSLLLSFLVHVVVRTLSHHLVCMPQLGSSCQADLDNDDDGLTDDPEAAALLAELGVPVKAAAPKAAVAAASSGAAAAVAPAAVVSPQVHTEPSLSSCNVV